MSRVRQRALALVNELRRRGLLGVAILAGSGLLATLIVLTAPQTEPQVREEKAWPVSVVTAAPSEMQPTLVAFGRVESRQQARIKVSVTAEVADVLTHEGSWVNKGDLLVRLNDEELRLALAVANAEYKRRLSGLATAKSDFELARNITAHQQELKRIAEDKLQRQLDLFNQKMASDALVDEVRREVSERAIALERHMADLRTLPNLIEEHEASVAEGQARVNRARLDLEQTRILAPFPGRVIATHVAPGDRVLPGEAIVEVADFSELEVRASVPARLGLTLNERLSSGHEVRALGIVDGTVHPFVLERVAGNVKRGQTGIDAFFRPRLDQRLDIGRVLNLNITLPGEQDVVALPVQSIYENDRVYRVRDNRLEAVQVVQVGDYVDSGGDYFVLVRSPAIEPGDKLVTTQLPRAITGMLVAPIDAADMDKALAAKPVPSDARLN